MALRVSEAWESGGDGELGRDSYEPYTIIIQGDEGDNADDEATIMIFALTKFVGATPLGNVISSFTREHLAPRLWKVTAHYRSTQADPTGNFSFSTTGGTQHITQSRETVGSYAPAGKTAPNFKGAIGVSGDTIAGTDIFLPVFGFKVTHYLTPQQMTTDFVRHLYTSTGKVNSDKVTFNVDGLTFELEPGELLSLGAEGCKRLKYGDWELTQDWAASQNVENMTIGPVEGITKRGFDYLWVAYDSDVDPNAKRRVQTPIGVYVERLYDYIPLNPIATPPARPTATVLDTSVPGTGTIGGRRAGT
jgi:hypothetical protein